MNPKRFVSWGIVGLFALQFVLFAVSFVEATPFGSGFVLWDVVMSEAILVNETIEFLLPVGFKSEDWWLGLAAMPVVYYATAIVIAALGRSAGRFGRRRLG